MSSKILGLSSSLRNARRGKGNDSLINDLREIKSKEELIVYLKSQAKIHLQNFVDSGRSEGIAFDKMYRNLKKLKGDRGLSNSEVALASALWSSKEEGCEIETASLSEFFLETSKQKDIDLLKEKLRSADGIILSTPVYFGDRSSLSQSFINLIKNDKELAADLRDKVYAGIAVGAKRNGGQETALIYQLIDMINCGFWGVGNDSETTSQYGGTGKAGDIGSMADDDYGLDTAMGTGRRISRVCQMMKRAGSNALHDKHRVQFWILQDKDDRAYNYIQELTKKLEGSIDAKILDISNKNIIRCIACDICPTDIDVDDVYRCIIKSKHDDLKDMHTDLLYCDAIIPVAYSPNDRAGLVSNYQRFLERTRYLRRGDYVFSDILTAPIVIEELEANENLHIRMMTSMLRHQTILSEPIIAYQKDGDIINQDDVEAKFLSLNKKIRDLAVAKLITYSSGVNHLKYKPVGYVLSAAKDNEDEKLLKRAEMIEKRIAENAEMAATRINKKVIETD